MQILLMIMIMQSWWSQLLQKVNFIAKLAPVSQYLASYTGVLKANLKLGSNLFMMLVLNRCRYKGGKVFRIFVYLNALINYMLIVIHFASKTKRRPDLYAWGRWITLAWGLGSFNNHNANKLLFITYKLWFWGPKLSMFCHGYQKQLLLSQPETWHSILCWYVQLMYAEKMMLYMFGVLEYG